MYDRTTRRYDISITVDKDGHLSNSSQFALALCALHHALFDLGVVGITEDWRISVSGLYVARNKTAGR